MDSNYPNRIGPITELVFLGGGRLLRDLAVWAKNEGFEVKVITAPRHGEEKIFDESLVHFLSKNRIKFLVTEKIATNKVRDFLSEASNVFYLSLGSAWIFSSDIIESLFNNMLFNLHGTRLPQNRGGGGPSWRILMGDRLGNCLIHRIDGGIDTGELIAYKEFTYPPSIRKPIEFQYEDLNNNFDFFVSFIEKFRYTAVDLVPLHQPEYLSSYWPRINTDINGWIDWSWGGQSIERFICAFDEPYPGAQSFLGDLKVRVKSVFLSSPEAHYHPFQSGLIYRVAENWCCVAVNGGTLIVEQVFDECGREILGSIRTGDRFRTPQEKLNDAKDRPVYTPTGLK